MAHPYQSTVRNLTSPRQPQGRDSLFSWTVGLFVLAGVVVACWLGSFDGHGPGLSELGVIELSDVPDGSYELVLFASRSGDDGGLGRLTRFTVVGGSQELEVSDNASNVVTFSNLTPQNGSLTIEVRVSPNGTGRFGYLGSLQLTKTAD